MNTVDILLQAYTLSEIEYMSPEEREEIAKEILESMKTESLSDVLGFNQ